MSHISTARSRQLGLLNGALATRIRPFLADSCSGRCDALHTSKRSEFLAALNRHVEERVVAGEMLLMACNGRNLCSRNCEIGIAMKHAILLEFFCNKD
ncbi:hypothetical protein Trydic_g6067 [Trypoxylus dichotomus]